MSTLGRTAALVALAAALTVPLAACGGGGGGAGRTTTVTIKEAAPTDAGSTSEVQGQDASAKSIARNAMSQVETCFAEQQTYVGCKLPTSSGLPVGSGPGEVEVSDRGSVAYKVTAHSESGCNFIISRLGSGVFTRTTSGTCSGTSW
jgi:type IV pilus assembly protein PilA